MPGKEIKGRSPRAMYSNGNLVGGQKKLDKDGDGEISGNDFALMAKGGKAKKAKKGTYKTKDGRTVKKGLYYYMNKRKKAGTSRPGKGTVSTKALKRSAKTAKKS
jgi:hypothetical protein